MSTPIPRYLTIGVGSGGRSWQSQGPYERDCRTLRCAMIRLYRGTKYAQIMFDLDPIYPLSLTGDAYTSVGDFMRSWLTSTKATFEMSTTYGLVDNIPIEKGDEAAAGLAALLDQYLPTGDEARRQIDEAWLAEYSG